MSAIPTLNSYLVRCVLAPFWMILSVLLLALSLERMLRLIEQISLYGAPLFSSFELLLYLIPHYLGLALPAALFLSVLLSVRRLHDNAELDILFASGVSLKQILLPILGFSLIVTVIVLGLVSYAQPHTRYLYRSALHDLKEQPLSLSLQAGIFQDIGKNTVIRVDQIDQDGKHIGGFFATTQHQDGSTSYISARYAKIFRDPAKDTLSIQLAQGRQITKTAQGKTRSLDFSSYPWSPDIATSSYGLRGQDERELTITELTKAPNENAFPQFKSSELETVAEFHARLTHALSLPFLAMLALVLALVGRGRTGQAGGLVAGIFILVLYEKILGFGESFAAAGQLTPYLSLWTPLALMATISVLSLYYKSEAKT